MRWTITNRQTFEASAKLFPVLIDVRDYRSFSEAMWRFKLDDLVGLTSA